MTSFRQSLCALFLLIPSLMATAQQHTISGHLTGKATPLISELQVYYEGQTHKLNLNKEEKTFSSGLDLSKPQFLELKIGSTSKFIYAVPGTDIIIDIDNPTLADNFIDIKTENIRILNGVMEHFYTTLEDNGINIKARNWSQDLFDRPDIADRACEETMNFITSNEQSLNQITPRLKEDFKIFSEAFNHYVRADLYTLEELEKVLQSLAASEMNVTFLTIPFYREFLTDITNAYAARTLESYDLVLDHSGKGYIAEMIAAQACVQYIPDKSVLSYLINNKLNRELLVSGIKHRKYIDFLFANADESTRKQFTPKYDALMASTSPGPKQDRIPARDFEFKSPEGKVYRLADFKGKMLLIDFWASWCAPCKIQMPYLKELEKHYEGKDIVIAKVSLDASKDAWLKGISDEGMSGVLLHAEGAFKNPFPVAYGINAIPRFMLIDADGKIISDNMPKPQQKSEVMAIIDEELFKKETGEIVSRHLDSLGVKVLTGGNCLFISSTQKLMAFTVVNSTWYCYPKKIRFEYQPEDNPTYKLALGEDFFTKKYLLMNNDSLSGNIADLYKTSEVWGQKLPGLELFAASAVDKVPMEMAEENFTNTENCYVLKAEYKNRSMKYYIDRETMLLKKVTEKQKSSPRQGGGTIEGVTKYDDYRDVGGLKLPHSYNMNNIVTSKITSAEVKETDDSVFRAPDL